MNHYRFTQRAFNVRNVSNIHLFSCLCCSCAFGLIHFIWRLTENPEPFISSSWKLRTTIPKPYVKRHHGVPFLIMLKNSLILSTELCIPLISALPSAPHAQSSYTTSPSSQRSLVLFYSVGVNAVPLSSIFSELPGCFISHAKPVFWARPFFKYYTCTQYI